jgi:hypothetical protein
MGSSGVTGGLSWRCQRTAMPRRSLHTTSRTRRSTCCSPAPRCASAANVTVGRCSWPLGPTGSGAPPASAATGPGSARIARKSAERRVDEDDPLHRCPREPDRQSGVAGIEPGTSRPHEHALSVAPMASRSRHWMVSRNGFFVVVARSSEIASRGAFLDVRAQNAHAGQRLSGSGVRRDMRYFSAAVAVELRSARSPDSGR